MTTDQMDQVDANNQHWREGWWSDRHRCWPNAWRRGGSTVAAHHFGVALMPRFMVRQRIERKIVLEAVDALAASAMVFDRYADNPDVKDPVARIIVHEHYDLPIAVKAGAYPAEIDKL